MTNIKELAEKALVNRQKLPDIFGPETLKPSYDGLGLVNIPALALQLLGVEADGKTAPPFNPDLYGDPEISRGWQQFLANGPINHVVVLLVDALGYDQLESQFRKGEAPNLARAANHPLNFFVPLTSVYPSTTTTALTAVATARTPQEHGIMATTVQFPRIGAPINLIHFSFASDNTPISTKLLNPDTLLPVPNIYKTFIENGIQASQINYYQFENSTISRFCSAGSGAKFVPYHTPAGCFTALRQTLENTTDSQKSYTYAYIPTIDTTAHAYGPLSATYEAELAVLDFAFQREIVEKLKRPDVLFILTADHGQRATSTPHIAWLNEHPELMRLMSAPAAGEGRAAYVYLRNGEEVLEKARAYIQTTFGDEFLVLTKAEALAGGLFGDPEQEAGQECLDRLGDLILLPRRDWQARQAVKEKYEVYPGVHGGLSRAEMLIPFLAMRLG